MTAPDNADLAVERQSGIPPLPPGAPKANGFRYRPRYGLIVEVTDEASQQALHGQLTQLGLKPKVVNV